VTAYRVAAALIVGAAAVFLLSVLVIAAYLTGRL